MDSNTGANRRTYCAVVGLPIQPTTGGRLDPLFDMTRADGTNRVVSTTVGITMTASLNRRAYAARYSFPAMTRLLCRMIVATLPGCLSAAIERFASLTL